MGVPKFFSWITRRYPLILQYADRSSLPEIDYLYLDMNGIIYKCSKDESIIFKSMVMSKKMEEIWLSIFNYISDIVDIIKPKKMLFLGLDGVAPRAKMNNQRSRRYKSAKQYAMMEKRLNDYGQKNEQNFKNNCITPGTEFMFELNRQLRFFIQKKIHEDPDWQKFKIMFSGGDVPGEGQHKIMDFIREGINQKVFDPNSKHCLYGADADLIMLAMTLNLKNLCIIRQEFVFNKNSKNVNISSTKNDTDVIFQLIYINILKEYFELQYANFKGKMKIQYDIQCIINDFVFLCFFIGNDFLPRCYCYDIREGHMERLIDGFKEFLLECDNYLLGKDSINIIQLQRLTGILRKSQSLFIASRQEELSGSSLGLSKSDSIQKQIDTKLIDVLSSDQPMKNQQQFLLALKTLYLNDDQAGVKKLFYESKFEINAETQQQQVTKIIDAYLNGLNYVYLYYFKTLPSWQWFYPYYYAPLVNDLHLYLAYKNQNREGFKPFSISQPYKPFKQLLCILPKQSYGLLPKCLQEQITNPQSVLRSPNDFFPDQVKVDPYGGKSEHEFISILPFIDQELITKSYDSVDEKYYTQTEKARNIQTDNEIYMYNVKENLTLVKSFYHYINDFKVSITLKKVNFLKDNLHIINDGMQKNDEEQNNQGLLIFPTLSIRPFTASLGSTKRGSKIYLSIINQKSQKQLKLGSNIFFGYPGEACGKILGICTKTEMIKDTNQFEFRDYDLQYQTYTVNQIWDAAQDLVIDNLNQRKGILTKSSDALYFVMISNFCVRKKFGKYIRAYTNPEYAIVPSCLVSTDRKYAFTKIPFVPASIQQEFKIHEKVIVLSNDYCGYSGQVADYSGDRKVRVELTRKLTKIPQNIIQKVKANDFFWSLAFASRLFNIDVESLLVLMDSVQIMLDDTLPSAHKMPSSIDIGLSFIKRNQKKLVPSLVRLPLDSEYIDQPYRQFKKLQISTTALQLLYEYYTKYPEVFGFLNLRTKSIMKASRQQNQAPKWGTNIYARDLWDIEDPNKKAIQVYLWLIKKQEVHEPNSNMNSTMISKNRINILLQYFKKQKKYNFSQFQDFDPNYILSSRLSKQGLLYLKNSPPIHHIGDRVICLNPKQFGQTGIVIGIDNNRQTLNFDVLFENPSFGKDDLGGLVDYLWGGTYKFEQLFNIDTWPIDIEPRKGNDRTGWDGSQPNFINSRQIQKNKKSQSVDINNYQKLLGYLDLEPGLEQFIKKSAKNNIGADWKIVANRGQRYINNLQGHQQTLLDSSKPNDGKVRYVAKQQNPTQQFKFQVREQRQEPGRKVFQKFVFGETDKQSKKAQTLDQKSSKPQPKYILKSQKSGEQTTSVKIKYVQKKIQKTQDQSKKSTTIQETKQIDINISSIAPQNNQSFSQDQTLLVIEQQLNKNANVQQILDKSLSFVESISSNTPSLVPDIQTQPPKDITKQQQISYQTAQKSSQSESNPINTIPKEDEGPKEQFDEDIFG